MLESRKKISINVPEYYMVDSMTKLVEENLAQSTDFAKKRLILANTSLKEQANIEHIFGK